MADNYNGYYHIVYLLELLVSFSLCSVFNDKSVKKEMWKISTFINFTQAEVVNFMIIFI